VKDKVKNKLKMANKNLILGALAAVGIGGGVAYWFWKKKTKGTTIPKSGNSNGSSGTQGGTSPVNSGISLPPDSQIMPAGIPVHTPLVTNPNSTVHKPVTPQPKVVTITDIVAKLKGTGASNLQVSMVLANYQALKASGSSEATAIAKIIESLKQYNITF